jgi:hypothetical protein
MSLSFVVCVLTLIAMFAPPAHARWTALVVGLCIDLLTTLPVRDGVADVRIIGPSVLAFLLATQLVLSVRSIMMRRNPLTLGVLSAIFSLAAGVTLVAIFSLRGWLLDTLAFEPTRELLTRAGGAIYTGLLGVALAFALLPLAQVLGLKPDAVGLAGRAVKY